MQGRTPAPPVKLGGGGRPTPGPSRTREGSLFNIEKWPGDTPGTPAGEYSCTSLVSWVEWEVGDNQTVAIGLRPLHLLCWWGGTKNVGWDCAFCAAGVSGDNPACPGDYLTLSQPRVTALPSWVGGVQAGRRLVRVPFRFWYMPAISL